MIQRTGEKCTVIPVGRIDANSAPQFADELNQALPGTQDMVLDFSQIEYISSSGLKVLLQAIKTMYAQGEFRIINVSDSVYDTLSLTGFPGICDIERQA